MALTPKIVAFSGSLRTGSYNQKLVTVAARAAEQAGADVTLCSLNDYPMPIFNEDIEKQGTPDEARAFKDLMISAHGVLIASPEYNGSLSGALKNAIDWASRPAEGEEPLVAFKNKACGLLSASPGGLGGIRGLLHLRPLLAGIQMIVVPTQFCLAGAGDKFDDDGNLTDDKARNSAEAVGHAVVDMAKRLHA
jgi:NAD(P)H-dependent FMN reductase